MSAATAAADLSQERDQSAQTAVVIDNAFDLQITDTVTKESAAQFAEDARADEQCLSDLQTNGIDLDAVGRREEAALLSLAAKRDSLVAARPAVETLLFDYLEERGPLDDLV